MRVVCLAITLLTVPLVAAPKVSGSASAKTAHVEGPRVRVLLAGGVNAALLEVKGPYRVIRRDCDTPTLLSGGGVGKRYVIHGIDCGLRWGEEFPDVAYLTVVPTSPQTHFFVNGFQYTGSISVVLDQSGQLTIVNETPMEDFVKSVLAVKYQQPVSREAGAALAIVERTRIFAQVFENQSKGMFWDVTARESGYCGYGVTHNNSGIDEAVDWTPFMIVQNVRGQDSLVDLRLPLSKAVELASRGCDAKRILSESFPHSTLGLTAEQVALR